MCGSDGVTYMSICDLSLQADVRLDYRGRYIVIYMCVCVCVCVCVGFHGMIALVYYIVQNADCMGG